MRLLPVRLNVRRDNCSMNGGGRMFDDKEHLEQRGELLNVILQLAFKAKDDSTIKPEAAPKK